MGSFKSLNELWSALPVPHVVQKMDSVVLDCSLSKSQSSQGIQSSYL